jgi:hypothetical protein
LRKQNRPRFLSAWWEAFGTSGHASFESGEEPAAEPLDVV